MLGTFLFIILILLLIGLLPAFPYSRNFGPWPSGVVGLLIVVLIVLLVAGYL